MRGAYYNEIDPFAAQWLRNLIAAGHIAPGDVDERSIEDVGSDDLVGYAQCHFFAGIGVWSYALRQSGWSDDRGVWTGSCPCQPFSEAGRNAGFDDERHLWPTFFRLIDERRPSIVFGEQVASGYVGPWVDLVCADVERVGYAFGAVAFPAAGVGAPHIRDRVYWVADAARGGRGAGLRDSESAGFGGRVACDGGGVRGMADAGQVGWGRGADECGPDGENKAVGGEASDFVERCGAGGDGPGPVNGFWRAADWLACRDGKWRAVEPGTFPLAHGSAARVGRLRAYGNAINAEAARTFITAAMQ